MKKAFLTLAVLLVCAALVIPVMAFDPVTANLTPDFTISKAAMPPVRDGVINPGEYTLISAYAPTNEDWFEAKYECVRRYAAASNPAYVIEIYGAWDDAGIYVAVKSDCNDHRANHDTVWKGCGVMIGFVPEDPSFPAYAEYEEGYSAMGDVLREIAYCYDGDELVLNNTTEDAVMGENAFTSYKRDGGFDIYEMFFTWDFISKTLKEGDSFGLGMMNSKIRPDWLCHSAMMENDSGGPYSYRNRLMSNQVKTLFGVEPTTLEMYARASQISQAEAKKFFIERFRVTKWRRTGIIWWNLIDGWPQISDAVVDWYGSKKLAYHYIRRSQNPFQLIFAEPELDGVRLPLFAVNDSRETVSFGYEVLDLTGSGGVVMSGEGSVEPDGIVRLDGYRIARGEKRFYLMKWKTADGACGVNHYMTNIRDIDLDEYLGYMKVCGFDAEFEGFGG